MENRKVVLTLALDKVAKDFGYRLEFDPNDDVYYSPWTMSMIRNSHFVFPKELDKVDQIFPLIVATALEDAERSAWASAMENHSVFALEAALEKIDLSGGGAEYQDLDGNMVSEKAGIISAKANLSENTIVVEILNPEHLINSVINGVGMFAPDLSTTEPESNDELIKKFHNLSGFFEVYGEKKPSDELPSNSSPSINDEYFYEMIKDRLNDYSADELAEMVIESLDETNYTPQDILKDAAKISGKSKKELKDAILKQIDKKAKVWTNLK